MYDHEALNAWGWITHTKIIVMDRFIEDQQVNGRVHVSKINIEYFIKIIPSF